MAEKGTALQYFAMSCVTTNSPNAPAPFAWTTLSGIRSLSKWAMSSMKPWSWSKIGPLGPTVSDLVFESNGAPLLVVSLSASWKNK